MTGARTARPDQATGPADPPAAQRAPRTRWAAYGALPLAVALWLLALRGVRLDRMGDLGLLQVLPPAYWAALALLAAGFVLLLRLPRPPAALAAGYVLALIAAVHATPSLLYPGPRYAWSWKHLAVVDAMLRHDGTVPHADGLDIYNQWPGFFQLNVLLLRATGLHSALGLADWYEPLANLLLLGPLLLLFAALTRDPRLIWGGAFLYYATSWVGQDYYSPQAFAYLLYLLVIALVVRRLAASTPSPDGPSPNGPSPGGRWRVGPFLLVLVLTAAVATSHQLTPLMLISTLLLLALPRRNRRTVLPVLAAAVATTVLWDATVARRYVAANLGDLTAALLSPDRNVLSGVAGLGAAAPGQVLVAWTDRATAAAVLLLALTALLVDRRLRRTGLPMLLAAPLPLLLANPYGGEMIFRAYLFALPAAAFLGATLLFGGRTPRPPWRTPAACAAVLVLLTGLLLGNYSKEAMNWFSTQEIAAVDYVAATAPPGSRLVSVTADLPGGERRYDQLERTVLGQLTADDQRRLVTDPLPVVQQLMDDPRTTGPSYLILTRAQAAECRLTGRLPADTVDLVHAAVAGSPRFQAVFTTPDAVVYRYLPPVAAPGGRGGAR
ncbi:glycosyltransferase [Kitasatospora sp. NPDC088134]|uniref:glycosyltransferase n=1 Tax=Kitasatospora sp. NPDC088134 TaxID=3364071 RepID=UPI00382AD4D7